MSVQWGQWNFDGRAVDRRDVARAADLLGPYGPDGTGSYTNNGIGIFYRGFATTRESRFERQPYPLPSGAILTWDGRLDNRDELMLELGGSRHIEMPDVEIVAACYEKWQARCFAKLLGDWALSLWNPHDRSLLLAKDFLGLRHLYYVTDQDQIIWSSVLDPLVLLSGHRFPLSGEYIAGWISSFPLATLTPYTGIYAVPPASYVLCRNGGIEVFEYWKFDTRKTVRHANDADYEEHFRGVFERAVAARLRSDRPILAELSGGMDSSSIVCVADLLCATGRATARIDTLSYFDDSEPNWDERPYFTLVEKKRGRAGYSIDVSPREKADQTPERGHLLFLPGSRSAHPVVMRQFTACLEAAGARVVLSGIGGDEVTGGVPTPLPELADLVARLRFEAIRNRLVAWALTQRTPVLHLIIDTLRLFLPAKMGDARGIRMPPPWVDRAFADLHQITLRGYPGRLRFRGSLPSFQENLRTLDALRRQIACTSLSPGCLRETRYPFLDRSLLEFLFAIPREQLIRPGQRRSLLRRSLIGIVPHEILARSRKASVVRGAITTIACRWAKHSQPGELLSAALGVVDEAVFAATIRRICRGEDVPMIPVLRMLTFEDWLGDLSNAKVVELESQTPAGKMRNRSLATSPRRIAARITIPRSDLRCGEMSQVAKLAAESPGPSARRLAVLIPNRKEVNANEIR
jgi:asparagine synthase (glutamine-hydrolysing)